MNYAAFFALAALPAFAAFQGTVTNQTTGKPQAGDVVTLMNLGAGMNTAGTAKTDAAGVFSIDTVLQPGAPYLIQVMHEGVTYNRMLPPGTQPTGISLEVYDVSAKVPDAKVTQHMILLEPSTSDLTVSQTIIFTNSSKTTYQDPEGTLKFQVPPSVSSPVQVRIMAPQGMPITRQAEKTKAANIYAVKYPVKPGETRIDISYSMPVTDKFAGRILHGGGPVRFVAPPGVRLEGPQLASLGPEPQTGSSIFELKGAEYAVNIQGTGSLQQAQAPSAGANSGGDAAEDPSGGIDVSKPRLYQRLPWVIGLVLAMLGLGLVIMFRADTTSAAKGRPGTRA